METIGDRLKEFGLEHFPTLTDFAREIGMSMQSLSMYIHNKREPGTGILRRLEKLGCSIDWLITGKEKIIQPVNNYQVLSGIDSNEQIDTLFYPFHKRDGMYCLYVKGGKIVREKKLPYEVLLIDKNQKVEAGDEVVVKTRTGAEEYDKLLSSDGEKVILVSVVGDQISYKYRVRDIFSLHKVVSRLIELK